MREIILDTETTGLNPLAGDRLVEIGCVESINHIPTQNHYHVYLNPERDVPDEASRVHGLTTEFLMDKPLFVQEVDNFLTFIEDDPLVIHNASFDMGFLNAELARAGFKTLPMSRAIDTLQIARKKFPGSPASLDALCKRFGVDSSARELHGALLDAELLAEVYLELCGGRQPDLAVDIDERKIVTMLVSADKKFREPRKHEIREEELTAHETFLKKIDNALWTKT